MERYRVRVQSVLPYCVLGAMTLFFCWLFVGRLGLFGSRVDWISQHSVIPDYFRQQFYDTGKLFPEFAANLGSGQNIYNFSYYGLYSPVILVSYLFPFVKMGDYLMAASAACLAASVMLFYGWMAGRGFRKGICFEVSVMFLLAGPMILQSHSQVMFVSYMPFLCLALIGTDRYFNSGKSRKSGLYTIGVFLMIMTSFYFSIGGILVLILYGLHRYFQVRETENGGAGRLTPGVFLLDGIQFLWPIGKAVLMSSVLLIPTAAVLFGDGGGRSQGEKISLLSLMIPKLTTERILYSGYGIGLTTLAVTALLAGLFRKKCSERILIYGCVILLSVPIFGYILNGGIYIRDKAMIPFLPILCYVTACYLDGLEREESGFLKGMIPYVLTLVWLICGSSAEMDRYAEFLIAEGILMLICFCIFRRRGSVLPLMMVPVLCLTGVDLQASGESGTILSREFYDQVTDKAAGDLIEETAAAEDGFYRIEQVGSDAENAANLNRIWDMRQYVTSLYSSGYHAGYQTFRNEDFGLEEPFRNSMMQPVTENPVFRRLMGVKYILSETPVRGYALREKKGNLCVYENTNVLPIGYATSRLLSEEEYRRLPFPYNQTALARYAVVEKKEERNDGRLEEMKQETAEAGFVLPEMQEDGAEIVKSAAGYSIRMKEKTTLRARILPQNRAEILYLQFRVKNHHPSKDVAVWVDGIRNKLSSEKHIYYNENTIFTYAEALEEEQTEIEITFGEGEYEICDIRGYTGSDDFGEEDGNNSDVLCQSEFQQDRNLTKGKRIQGTIQAEEDGYFITSIPYDTGFEVRVDGQRTAYEKVNTAFLGFPIEAGGHQVEIVYHAAGMLPGKLLSLLGWILFGIGLMGEKKNREHIGVL